jgi:hypothetical protein
MVDHGKSDMPMKLNLMDNEQLKEMIGDELDEMERHVAGNDPPSRLNSNSVSLELCKQERHRTEKLARREEDRLVKLK